MARQSFGKAAQEAASGTELNTSEMACYKVQKHHVPADIGDFAELQYMNEQVDHCLERNPQRLPTQYLAGVCQLTAIELTILE